MAERSPNGNDPIGKVIRAYQITGVETDGTGQWVGADIELTIPPIVGRFVVNVMTVRHTIDETIKGVLEDVDHPQRLLEGELPDQRDSFVLNDKVITDTIIATKFKDRVVEADLADCLWHVVPLGA
jgi:hypothetical protein